MSIKFYDRRIWGWAVALGVAVLALILAYQTLFNMEERVRSEIERRVQSVLAAQTIARDRFEVIFCGTGSPQYQPDRGQSCLVIVAAGKVFLFDAGQGAAQSIQSVGLPLTGVQTVFLTHLHTDHISGLSDVLHTGWLNERQSDVRVYGPPGTVNMLDAIKATFSEDVHERAISLDGAVNLDPTHAFGEAKDIIAPKAGEVEIYNADGVSVSAFKVDHPHWMHAYGYQFRYRGKRIVISGDTIYSANLISVAKKADILIHEAINLDLMNVVAEILSREGSPIRPARIYAINETHTPTLELARLASESEVKHLYVTHLIPSVAATALAEQQFIAGMSDIYNGPITVARDGMRINMGN